MNSAFPLPGGRVDKNQHARCDSLSGWVPGARSAFGRRRGDSPETWQGIDATPPVRFERLTRWIRIPYSQEGGDGWLPGGRVTEDDREGSLKLEEENRSRKVSLQ